jgi:hypothetical protein
MQPLTDEDRATLARLRHEELDCLPLREQVRYFSDYLFDRGDTLVTPGDFRELFLAAAMVSPGSGKAIRPTEAALRTALERLLRAGELPFVASPQGYVVPWEALLQDWQFTFQAASPAKAEGIAQRLNHLAGGPQPFVPRPQRVEPDETWTFTTSVRLKTRAWPCAVAEALRNSAPLSQEWLYQGDGRRVASARNERLSQPLLIRAGWRLRPLPKDDATGSGESVVRREGD